MLGRRSDLAGGEHPYLDHVRRDSFYGFLALHREELFRDEDFADLYCLDNGRPSVSPSLLATALLLQAYEGASDEEAKARADFDLRWKVALGVGLEGRSIATHILAVKIALAAAYFHGFGVARLGPWVTSENSPSTHSGE